ncbi:MAG: hypothetical protein H6729_12375 [Deltaproteobacteria bacterium]|nr:hypothetical protein [Deltaproteobacteria bacterium]
MSRILDTRTPMSLGGEAYANATTGRSVNPTYVQTEVRLNPPAIQQKDPGFAPKDVFSLVQRPGGQWERHELHTIPHHAPNTFLGGIPLTTAQDLPSASAAGIAFGVDSTDGNTYWLQAPGQNYGISANPYG